MNTVIPKIVSGYLWMFNKAKIIFFTQFAYFFVDIRDINICSCRWSYSWYKYFTNVMIPTFGKTFKLLGFCDLNMLLIPTCMTAACILQVSVKRNV